MSLPPGRLPKSVKPSRYDLTLGVDIDTLSLQGHVVIHLDVMEPTDTITLNAIDFRITTISWHNTGYPWDKHSVSARYVKADPQQQMIVVPMGQVLAAGEKYKLELNF